MTKSEAIKYIKEKYCDECLSSCYYDECEAYLAISALEKSNTAYWKPWEDDYESTGIYECSNCSETWILYYGTPEENNMNYCPKCGAQMIYET